MASVAIAFAVLQIAHLRGQEPTPHAVSAERLAVILAGEDPKTIDELKAMQTHVQDLVKRNTAMQYAQLYPRGLSKIVCCVFSSENCKTVLISSTVDKILFFRCRQAP